MQQRWDKPKIQSGHLYQLFAYLKNAEKLGGNFEAAEGILIYPTVHEPLTADLQIQGHRVRALTLDLRAEWSDVRESLLALI